MIEVGMTYTAEKTVTPTTSVVNASPSAPNRENVKPSVSEECFGT